MKLGYGTLIPGVMLCAVVMAGCPEKKQGPLERAGERMDEIGDNIRDGENPLKEKGTMEKAGEAVDDALDNNRR